MGNDLQLARSPRAERLTNRDKEFIRHYLTDAYFNQTRAAAMVGLKSPDVAGSRMLGKIKVRKYLDEQLEIRYATKPESLIDLARMARGAAQYFIKNGSIDLESDTARDNYDLITSIDTDVEITVDKNGIETRRIKTKVKFVDKLAARTVLARVQGLLNNDTSQSTVINQTLTINQIKSDAKDAGVDIADVLKELPDVIRMLQISDATILESMPEPDAETIDAEA